MSEEQQTTTNQIKWTIHDTNPDLVEPVRARLGEVVDPEIGMNIIQLGLVRDVSLENDIGHLKMILTTPFCPYGPAPIEMLPEVWDFSMMEDPSALDWGMYS